jgi:O-glycosyl hydrolase
MRLFFRSAGLTRHRIDGTPSSANAAPDRRARPSHARSVFAPAASRLFRAGVLFCLFCCAMSGRATAQAAVALPDAPAAIPAGAARFQFVSDGPPGSGWDHGDRIARYYVQEWLPAFFSRTLVLDGDIPRRTSLSWIFTGPHAGFTVVLGAADVRVTQRYYDSYALYGSGEPQQVYPQSVVDETDAPFTGHARSLTVSLDSHLALRVSVNGRQLVEQRCLFDVQRSQLEYDAPRTAHDVVSGALLPQETSAANVTVDPRRSYQTMMGFGGSPSAPAYAMLSDAGKKKYWEMLRSYNLLIDREYPMGTRLSPDMSNLDNLADASPHYYGDNFPNGEVSDFDYNRRIQEIGGSVIYEMWDLPAWATQPQPKGAPPHRHGIADPEAYARAMVTYCRIEKERTGRPPAIVGIQNEVDEPEPVFMEMVRLLRKRLDEAGFSSVKIHMADAPYTWQGVQRAEALKRQPEVWNDIDFAAVHEYDYQDLFANPDLFDGSLLAMRDAASSKPFLATEIAINKPSLQAGSYRVAFNVGQLYHKNLTIMNAVGLLYCWVILDAEQPNFGASRSLLVPDRQEGFVPVPSSDQLRVLGAFSRHILSGMVRVDARSSDPDLLATAFRGANGDLTVVMLNRSTQPVRVTVDLPGVTWREMERTSQYLENAVSAPSSDPEIQPGEILTLSTIVRGSPVH